MTNTMPNQAKVMIGMVAAASLCPLAFGVINSQALAWSHLGVLMFAAALTSRLKVKLPGMTSTMSANLPVILLAITQLGLTGGLLVTVTAAIAQSYASATKTKAVQFLFNTCTLMNACGMAYAAYHLCTAYGTAVSLAAASTVYFLANTLPVAGIIGLTEGKNPFATWHKVFLWSFPNYVIGAGLAAFASLFTTVGLATMATLVVVLFGVFRSYKMYVGLVEEAAAPRAVAMAAGR